MASDSDVPERYRDRRHAGAELARELAAKSLDRPVVMAIPRGGVPVGAEVADSLGAPLDVFVVRKVGAPEQPEYGIGAVAEGGTVLIRADAVADLRLSKDIVDALVDREFQEAHRRVDVYRAGESPVHLRGRSVVVVDDGVATGITDAVALEAIRRLEPASVTLAVPVCAPAAAEGLRGVADDFVCPYMPSDFFGVGQAYRDFGQVGDAEVISLLADRRRRD